MITNESNPAKDPHAIIPETESRPGVLKSKQRKSKRRSKGFGSPTALPLPDLPPISRDISPASSVSTGTAKSYTPSLVSNSTSSMSMVNVPSSGRSPASPSGLLGGLAGSRSRSRSRKSSPDKFPSLPRRRVDKLNANAGSFIPEFVPRRRQSDREAMLNRSMRSTMGEKRHPKGPLGRLHRQRSEPQMRRENLRARTWDFGKRTPVPDRRGSSFMPSKGSPPLNGSSPPFQPQSPSLARSASVVLGSPPQAPLKQQSSPEVFQAEATVIHPSGVFLNGQDPRSQPDMGSPPPLSCVLPQGTEVKIIERVGDLLHVIEPLNGWVLENVSGIQTLRYKRKWFLGKYPKSTVVPSEVDKRLCAVSYITPSQVRELPHLTWRPRDAKIDSSKIELKELPQSVFCALDLSSLDKQGSTAVHDEYIMKSISRCATVEKYQTSVKAGEELPWDLIPILLQAGHTCIGHFYWDYNKHNVFPFEGLENQIERANLILTVRPTVYAKPLPDKKTQIEMEFFTSKSSWITMSDHERAALQKVGRSYVSRILRLCDSHCAWENLVLTSHRMSHSHEMTEHQEIVRADNCITPTGYQRSVSCIKSEYFYYSGEVPVEYKEWFARDFKRSFSILKEPEVRAGLTRYIEVFSDEELQTLEDMCDALQQESDMGAFSKETSHNTMMSGQRKRTKHFFRARYLWTREQMDQRDADDAGGIRTDVDLYPSWMNCVIDRLVDIGACDRHFINAIALNMYHDGTIGIGLHQDCYSRFARPIITLRLFSPARLSLGGKGLGENGLSIVDLPRGAVLLMEENSFACDGVKHCVRSCDMVGKSAALILRRVHEDCLQEADQMKPRPTH